MAKTADTIAIYSRKSRYTGKGESIGNQIDLCREYIRTHYGDAAAQQAVVFEDEGFSGGNLNRPDFKKMMTAAKERKFKAIVVYRLDRISRNISDFSNLIEELGRLGIDFVSIRESFDTSSPMGRAMMYIASVFSQLERETIAERIRDNMHELAKTGRWLGGTTPTGYASESVKIITVDGKTKKACKLKLLPDEAEIIYKIFDLYEQYDSLTMTETELLRQGIKTKTGRSFTRFSIKSILQNPVYLIADKDAYQYFVDNEAELFSPESDFDGVRGVLAYNRSDQEKGRATVYNPISEWIVSVGEHPGIISSNRWIRVQESLERNRSKSYHASRGNEALLTGLLSHIGMKDADKQEYTGARNARFSIFPGSGLFKKPPKWTMVAELVETSRLWGRIAARIEPEWVEPVAQHLIKRSYSEPHWERAQGAVMATEKVTVYGLPIVAARKVNYSQIDPALCRELFIRHALVEGDWQTRHAFFRENLKLRAEIEELEHKSRRRDILVDDETMFEFYDQRISHDVISARHFDKWWKQASRETPDLLNFEKSMLIKEGAEQVSKLDYPNFWHQGNLKLRLSYQFEPGADADGVTVHIPLPLLNQVEEAGFEWQIPGLRRELIIALIKSLPKPVRRNFVPAPNYAEAFLGRATPLELPLLDSLERELRKMTGVTIDREAWQWDQVPDHLKITFRVVDDKNKKLQEGRSLQALKDALKGKVQETLSAVADDGIEQSGLHIWSFGTLAESYEQKRGNYKVKAWPALVDERDSVAIKLFDNPQEQQQAMWRGLRRLLLLNIPSPIKYLHEKLPNKAKLGLYFNPYGKVLDLIDDCISCGVDKLIDEAGGPVWTEEGFSQLHDKVRAELNDTVVEIAKQVEQILTAVFNINKRLKGRVDMTMALGLSDIKAQMAGLVYRGFVTGNGFRRLGDTLRYLQAIEKRLEKMAIDPHRDRAQMLKVESVQQAWQQWLNKLPPNRREDDDVREIRWMIEELRVSFFAQQLGTPYPISDKRVLQAMEQITP